MRSDDRDPSLPPDELLRHLLEPPAGTAKRIVASALRKQELPFRGMGRPLAAGLVAAMLLVASLLTAGRVLRRPPLLSHAPPPAGNADGGSYSISNSGKVVTVTDPSGQVELLVSGDAR
ncbi:MAG: hypothetical protein KDD47_17510 [Acidobacteria bacterium]|nr:hypothetical protein [Acidobacteriota bacterium]